MTKTPLTERRAERLRGLDTALRAQIRGQDHVLERVVSTLRRGELGLGRSGRPRGSFLFLGPTGVGKTELARVFTAFLVAQRARSRWRSKGKRGTRP